MPRFRSSWVFLIFLLIMLAVGVEVRASSPTAGAPPQVSIHPDRMEVSWSAPALETREVAGLGVRIWMEGFDEVGEPGLPRVPMTSLLIALPPGSSPTLEFHPTGVYTLPLASPLAVNPAPDGVERDPLGNATASRNTFPDQGKPFAPAPVELEVLGVMRGVHLARLVYYPVLPVEGGVQVTPKIEVGVRFNSRTYDASLKNRELDSIQQSLKTMVVNPQHLVPFEQVVGEGVSEVQSPSAVTQAALIEVSTPGITLVTYQELLNAGFPVSLVNPSELQLWQGGNPVGIEWVGDSDTIFESGEQFYFFADPRPSKWTNTDVYLLTERDVPGTRIGSGSGNPSGLPVGQAYTRLWQELNSSYISEIPASWSGDHWYWDQFTYPTDTVGNYSFNLPTVNTSQPGGLELWLVGYTDVVKNPDHRVAAYLNAHPLPPEVEWNGKQLVHVTLDVPSGTFLIGTNQLTLTMPGITGVIVEGMWLDAFSVKYPLGSASLGDRILFTGDTTQHAYSLTLNNLTGLRVYDVTNPASPLKLTLYGTNGNQVSIGDPSGGGEHRYAAANQNGVLTPVSVRLRSALSTGGAGFEGADYLVITHPDFESALTPLLDLRTSQGLIVAVEDVLAIYDNYDDGRPTPAAIKAFLNEAYYSWTTRPTYVLLVGDGTADPRHYQANSFETYIPPYLANVDPWVGETAADNRYVTLEGGDVLPDMLIGRLPVNSLAQAQVVVAKIEDYELSPVEGDWYEHVTFVTDDSDEGGTFWSDADYLAANFIDDVYTISKIYHNDGVPPETTRAAIINNWNTGPGMITYIGHGSQHTWGGESLFHISNISELTNGGRLPVVLELTCLTGAFQTSGLDAIDENLLREQGGGAVGVWGPTGYGLARGHVQLAEGFFGGTYQGGRLDLGTAILAGKVNLMATVPSYDDLVDTFTLFGDPALKLHLSFQMNLYLPIIIR